MSIIDNIIDSDLRGFKVNDEIVVDKNVIGEFIKNSAKLTILNKNHQYDSLEKTYLNITNFGKWYVDNLNNNEESVEADLTLFDLSIKFDVDYEDTFSFPATLGEWANWIGNKVGVPLKGTFLNSDKQLTEKPYLGNNPKYRTAVKIIAKYASGWAEINEDETYSIRWFDNTTINIEDWEKFKHGSTSNPVNIIILSTGVTEDNVRYPEQIPTNAHELRIEDDWLAIDRYAISKSIFEQVNGFSYTSITELTLPYGLLEFKVGQKIKAKDIELNEIESYISSHTLTWDGGDWNDPNSWTSTLKMDELKETTTKYQYSNSIENRVGKTEINCDKNNKQINMLVEDVEDIEKDITTSKTANGNPIEITDAGEYPLERMIIEGKSYQKTTTGSQLLDFSKLAGTSSSTVYSFSNDELKISGTKAYCSCQIDITNIYKDNAGEFLYFNFENISGSRFGAPVQLAIQKNGTMGWKSLVDANLNKKVLEIPQDNSNITYVAIQFESNNTSIDQESNIIILKPILSFNQTLKYESYTGGIPSPNAKYPKEIETVQGVTNYFDNKFRQGTESGETSPIYIFSKSNINFKKGSYVFKTNLDLSKYFYAVFGNTNKFPNSVQQTYNSGWKSNNTFSFNFSQDLYFGILIKKKDNSNITPKELENFKFQLEKGTIAHDYVPYGRWINQKTIGINKFNGETESGSYNSQTGLKVNNSAATRNKYPIEVESNKDYIFSNDGVWVGMNVFEYDNNYNLIKYSIITDYVGQFFTTTEKTRYINFFRSNTNVDKVQLNLGKEVLPYESYKENTALIDMNKENLFDKSLFDSFTHNLKYINLKLKPNTIYTLFSNLPTQGTIYNLFFYTKGGSANSDYNGVSENNPISAMSDSEGYVTIAYRDYNNLLTNEIENYYYNLYEGYEPHYEFAQLDEAKDIFDNGTLIKNTDKLIFNGDTEENWHLMSDSSYQSDDCLCVWKNLNFNITSNDIFCSHFKCVLTIPDFKLNLNKIYINPNYNQLFINIPKTLVPDLASFKVWLKNQYDVGTPVVFYYQLAEPQTYQLPYEPLKLHKGYNYITLNDDLYPNMQIEYLTDSKFNANYATKSELKMKSNEITLGVEGKLKNYSTTTETHAMVDAIVEEESAKVEISVSQKIEDIQIGGTNLLRDTQNFGRNGVSANTMGYLMRFSSVEETTKYQGLTIRTLASTNTTLIMAQYYVNNCKNGEEYTTSFYAKGNGSLRAYFYGPSGYIPVSEILVDGKKGILNSDGRADIQLTGGWKRYNIVYKLADTGGTTDIKYLLFRNDNVPTAWSMCGIKLEKGNKATDWSSAPEDKADVTDVNAKLELVVKKTDNDQVVSMFNASADDVNIKSNRFSLVSTYCTIAKTGKMTLYDDGGSDTSFSIKRKNGDDKTQLFSGSGYFSRKVFDDTIWCSILQQADGIDGRRYGNLILASQTGTNQDSYKGLILSPYEIYFDDYSTVFGRTQATIAGKRVITGTYGNNADVYSLALVGNPKYLEVVSGQGAYAAQITPSDKRLKRRVKDSKYNAINTIMKIRYRQFIYRNSTEKWDIGVIADELQEIDPMLVFEVGKQKIKHVNTFYWQGILSKGEQELYQLIKEKEETIDLQHEKIEMQQHQLCNQDKRITELENQVKKLLELVEGKKKV